MAAATPRGIPIPRSKGRQSSAGSVILLPRPDRDKPREITVGAMNQSHNRPDVYAAKAHYFRYDLDASRATLGQAHACNEARADRDR